MFLGHGQKIFFKVYVISDLEALTDSKNLISFSQESSEKMLSLGNILTIFNFEAHFEPKFDFSGLGHKIFFKVYVLSGL